MSEGEISFWINCYIGVAILGVLAWCIKAMRDERRERVQRKRIERIMRND